MAFMTVSTGVGGGVVLDGRLFVGASGLAGHLGQVLSDPAGPAAGSGHVGTLEVVASGQAIAAAAERARGRPVEPPAVFAAATAGEDWASAIVDRSAGAVARALSDLRAVLDIELAVVGGGVGLAPGYLDRVLRQMAEMPAVLQVPIAAAGLGGDAGLIGVADWFGRDDAS